MSLIASSTMAGQALLLVLSPVLTRLYTPSEFGTLAVFAAVTVIVSTVSGLRWELAVPLARDNEQGLDLLLLSALSLLTISAIVGGLLLPLGPRFVEATGTPALEPLLWCFPLAILGGGAYQILSYWVLRLRTFGVIASTTLTRTGVQAASQVAFGLASMGAMGLVLGQVLGQLSGSSGMLRIIRRDSRGYRPTMGRLLLAAKEFQRFPLLTAPATLLNVAGRQAPALLVATLAGPAWAGFYTLAERAVNMPMRAVGNAVAQVFYGELSELVRLGDWSTARRTFLRTTLGMLGVAVVPALALATLGPWLFGVVFGSEWRVSGEIARILGALMIFQLSTSPISQTLNLFQMQGTQLAIDGCRLVAVLVAMTLSWKMTGDPLALIAGYVGAVASLYTVLWVASYRAIVGRAREQSA